MSNNINADTEVVFEYTGEGCAVPKDVTIYAYQIANKHLFSGGKTIARPVSENPTYDRSMVHLSFQLTIGRIIFSYLLSIEEMRFREGPL